MKRVNTFLLSQHIRKIKLKIKNNEKLSDDEIELLKQVASNEDFGFLYHLSNDLLRMVEDND